GNAGLRINEAGLDIIREAEGLSLTAYAAGGRSYIGYGHQQEPGDPMQITLEEAEALLREDVRATEDGVRLRLARPANENQFSAMVSLAFNIGTGAFGSSTVLRSFNAGDIPAAADAFLLFNKANGEIYDHLIGRRERERALFLAPVD
ncbi:MAG: lysozyme, partial [Alphaproteobacteria bacterium]|nr:lysozyme [Alphaproteobacteria bacterium]